MDITKDRDALVERALQKLGVVGSGQSADAEDAALVDGVVDAVLGDLAARKVYCVGNEDEIEVAGFEWLAMLLANAVAEDFGRTMDPGKQAYAESRLRALVAGEATYEPQTTDYF
jgi:hypothetical protein